MTTRATGSGEVDLRSVAATALPLELARVHRASGVGDRIVLRCPATGPAPTWPASGPPDGTATGATTADVEDLGAGAGPWPGLADLVEGAGLAALDDPGSARSPGDHVRVEVEVRRSLPDTVGPAMALLACGLNPSEHAADAGVGFVTPSNRFWPAAIEAGLVEHDRDPDHALAHGLGMTDLVKRATPRADVLTTDEYRTGLARVARLCRWLRPGAVCFVGLAGWRAAVDRRATAGVQDQHLGGVPVYVSPSTSGLNARTSRDELVAHLAAALDLARGRPAPTR